MILFILMQKILQSFVRISASDLPESEKKAAEEYVLKLEDTNRALSLRYVGDDHIERLKADKQKAEQALEEAISGSDDRQAHSVAQDYKEKEKRRNELQERAMDSIMNNDNLEFTLDLSELVRAKMQTKEAKQNLKKASLESPDNNIRDAAEILYHEVEEDLLAAERQFESLDITPQEKQKISDAKKRLYEAVDMGLSDEEVDKRFEALASHTKNEANDIAEEIENITTALDAREEEANSPMISTADNPDGVLPDRSDEEEKAIRQATHDSIYS